MLALLFLVASGLNFYLGVSCLQTPGSEVLGAIIVVASTVLAFGAFIRWLLFTPWN